MVQEDYSESTTSSSRRPSKVLPSAPKGDRYKEPPRDKNHKEPKFRKHRSVYEDSSDSEIEEDLSSNFDDEQRYDNNKKNKKDKNKKSNRNKDDDDNNRKKNKKKKGRSNKDNERDRLLDDDSHTDTDDDSVDDDDDRNRRSNNIDNKNDNNNKTRDELKDLKKELKKMKKEVANIKKSKRDDSRKLKKRLKEYEKQQQSRSVPFWKDEREFDDEVGETLPEDTFSFLILSRPCSLPFWLPMVVLIFQVSIFVMVALDILNFQSTDNILNLPANVTVPVRITQFLAIITAILTQDDIRTGLSLLREGYNEDALYDAFVKVQTGIDESDVILEESDDEESSRKGKSSSKRSEDNLTKRGAKPKAGQSMITLGRWKWHLSVFLRLLEGTLGLLVTFLLIVTSPTVIDLLLNFTAMAFVSQLDDTLFYLSKEGFVGKYNKAMAHTVEDTHYHINKETGPKLNRFFLLLLILLAMFVGWAFIIIKQTSGKLFCSTIYVQFGDDYVSSLSTFSGLYDRYVPTQKQRYYSDDRVYYLERRSNDNFGKPQGRFAYCKSMHAWTFSLVDDDGEAEDSQCTNWQVKSEITVTFDLAKDASSLRWYERDVTTTGTTTTDSTTSATLAREIKLDYIEIECFDCDYDKADDVNTNVIASGGGFRGGSTVISSTSTNDKCHGHGICSNAVCQCDMLWYGMRCEYAAPCPLITTDNRFDKFPVSQETNSNNNIVADAGAVTQSNNTTTAATTTSGEKVLPPRIWPNRYRLLTTVGMENNGTNTVGKHAEIVTVYDRPVYIHESNTNGAAGIQAIEIILYTGRRWVMTLSSSFIDIKGSGNNNYPIEKFDLIHYFTSNSFHAYWSNYTIYFISSPMDYSTTNDLTTPTDVQWYFPITTTTNKQNNNMNAGNVVVARYQEPDINRGPIDTLLTCA